MQSCRPVYIPVSRSPLLGLLGLGLGCPTPVMANGAEMKARGLAAVHGLLLILVAPFSAFPFLCFFLLPYRSWLPAAVAPLFWRISGRQACSDVFGVGAARLVCFPYLGFGSSVAVSGNGGMRLLSPCFCERKGFIDGIPTVVLGVAGGGSGCWLLSRQRRIPVPLRTFLGRWPMGVHRQSCAWVLVLGASSCGSINV
jgi:hypothetical protein